MRKLAFGLILGLFAFSDALAQVQYFPAQRSQPCFLTVYPCDTNVSAANPLPTTSSGGSTTANQGTPNAGGANAWPVAQSPATPIACAALCANLVVKASPGTLFTFDVSADSTLSGAAWWLMVYNATAAPGDGAVTPAKCYAVPSGATGINGSFDSGGETLGTGIVLGVSTSGCFTKTASTHAFISGAYQ